METIINTGTVKRGRGRPKGTFKKMKQNPYTQIIPKEINFNKDAKLKDLNIDPKMLEVTSTGLVLDNLISYEGGLPRATNLMFGGDPGVGKTTILLDYLSALQNKGLKCLFVSAEMQRKMMFKYTDRFPQFGCIETIFPRDYSEYNFKDVFEQKLDVGYDVVLIDSIAEVLGLVRGDCDWDKKEAERWFVSICYKHNDGENKTNKFTSIMGIQQLNSSNGEFVGGAKLQYLFDGSCKILVDKETDSKYMEFIKNRNGKANERLFFDLTFNKLIYGTLEAKIEGGEEE